MEITPATVDAERDRVRSNDAIPALVNDVRDRLGTLFEAEVGAVSATEYRTSVDEVFANGDVAVNVAALCGLLRDLDCEGDYPGFVVDEILGRELAGTIAGAEPLTLLAQATFHFADVTTHTDGGAGVDDLDAALAAGFQTRLPGWSWREGPSPFSVDS